MKVGLLGRSASHVEHAATRTSPTTLSSAATPIAPPEASQPSTVRPRTAGRRRATPAWVRTTHALLITADALVAPVLAGLVAATGSDLGTHPNDVFIPVIIGAMWLVALAVAGGYDARRATDFREESRSVALAAVGLAAMIAVATHLFDLRIPRLLFVLTVIGLPAVSLIARHAAHAWVATTRRTGDLLERTLVVGRIDRARALADTLAATPQAGYEPVGISAYPMPGRTLPPDDTSPLPLSHAETDLLTAVDTLDVDVVLLAADSELSGMPLRRLTWALEERGIDVVIHPGLLDVARPRLTLQPRCDLPLLSVRRPGAHRGSELCKAVYDRVLAGLILLLLTPLLLVTALAVRLTSRGPVIYRQTRIGRHGEPFTILKFRTMTTDADARRESLASANEGNELLFKMRQDPRVTPVGQLLRRFSVDELPQLVNVLRGEMSLVGPRPPLPSEVAQYSPDDLRRLHTRPGLTGLWQVSGRSDLDWEESVRLDLRYVDNWSPLTDLHILARTASAVVSGRGAY